MNPQRGQEGGSAFVYPITVGPDAIDELDHVNNAVYLTWVQQAITAYWVAHAPAEEVAKIAWIALRHDIKYRSEAFVAEVDTTLCCIDRETRQLHRITHELARHFAIVA